ncbi:hypothetical protein AGR7B_pAt0236 [Agrobacterium deltaense RV3]|nr:hypothetical protein AGR7B_pAt0236 [Agrobacterium deltaense RV3]
MRQEQITVLLRDVRRILNGIATDLGFPTKRRRKGRKSQPVADLGALSRRSIGELPLPIIRL